VRGRTRFLVAAAVAVVTVLGAALALRAWYEREPPPLDESGPGTALRLTAEPGGGVPAARFGVRLPDGSSTTLSMAGIATRQGRAVGQVSVLPPAGAARQLTLAEGESGQAGGVTVTLVHVWRMPDPANDALDVRVESVGS
jgi:hypothetical protein